MNIPLSFECGDGHCVKRVLPSCWAVVKQNHKPKRLSLHVRLEDAIVDVVRRLSDNKNAETLAAHVENIRAVWADVKQVVSLAKDRNRNLRRILTSPYNYGNRNVELMVSMERFKGIFRLEHRPDLLKAVVRLYGFPGSIKWEDGRASFYLCDVHDYLITFARNTMNEVALERRVCTQPDKSEAYMSEKDLSAYLNLPPTTGFNPTLPPPIMSEGGECVWPKTVIQDWLLENPCITTENDRLEWGDVLV